MITGKKQACMKAIVKLSMMLALAAMVPVFSANAQPGPGKCPHGKGHGFGPGFGSDSCHIQLMVEDMADSLSLTDEQKAAILDIHYTHMQEMKSISGQYQNDCVGEREARIASRNKMDEAIKKVLSDDQLAKYNEFMEGRRGPHCNHHQNWHKD